VSHRIGEGPWRSSSQPSMSGGIFFKVGGTSARQKTIDNFCGLNWQLWRHKNWNMTSLPTHLMKV